jgi:hypothetical protein
LGCDGVETSVDAPSLLLQRIHRMWFVSSYTLPASHLDFGDRLPGLDR